MGFLSEGFRAGQFMTSVYIGTKYPVSTKQIIGGLEAGCIVRTFSPCKDDHLLRQEIGLIERLN